MLTWAGFKCYKHDNIHYYAFNTTPSHAASAAGKQSESAASAGISQQPPIVLLHGVGMGLLPYINFALALASTGGKFARKPSYQSCMAMLYHNIHMSDQGHENSAR